MHCKKLLKIVTFYPCLKYTGKSKYKSFLYCTMLFLRGNVEFNSKYTMTDQGVATLRGPKMYT